MNKIQEVLGLVNVRQNLITFSGHVMPSLVEFATSVCCCKLSSFWIEGNSSGTELVRFTTRRQLQCE